MDADFIAITDMEQVAEKVAVFAETAESNRLYSMADIVDSMYGCGGDHDSDEFRRVSQNIGPALVVHGFKRVYWKNKRYWVRKS